ncbi:MAG TPA: hypothetical protein VJ922_03750 [Actinomycetota bacterium]|nr:hypothetical protein [Actinomycetota bacterium]
MTEPRVSTTHLGQFTEEHAEAIAKALEEAGMVWWHKSSGRLVRTLFAGDWGVRIFVDSTRLDEAKEIVRRVAASFEKKDG